MLLIANSVRDDQAALLKSRQLALCGAGPSAGIPNQLGRVETSLRLAKEHAQDTLLRLRKQRVCEASVGGAAGSWSRTQLGYNRARLGPARQRGQQLQHSP
jgi:hypothetical protein